jgi:histidine triad (HIT) family protein
MTLHTELFSEPKCLFCKIIAGSIPAKKVHEDEHMMAFHDIAPWAPVHILLVPKKHIVSMDTITLGDSSLLGHMMALSTQLMHQLGVRNGFRHIINTGRDGRQEIAHLHIHVMGGDRPWVKG